MDISRRLAVQFPNLVLVAWYTAGHLHVFSEMDIACISYDSTAAGKLGEG